MRHVIVLSVLLAGSTACELVEPSTLPPQPAPARDLVELDGSGGACAYSVAPEPGQGGFELDFLGDASAQIQVILEDCAAGCADDIESSCTITDLGGGVLEIVATGSYTVPAGPTTCTDECIQVAATCDSPALPAGDYTLQYGSYTQSLTVPSAPMDPPCLGDGV